MSKLSGIRDIDREILSKLDNKDLLKSCSLDKYTWNIVCDDNFLKKRLSKNYPKIDKYKSVNESWKKFFLRAIHYTALLKEKYNYQYEFGDFEKQYKLFEDKFYNTNDLLYFSAAEGELALVIWSIEKGATIYEEALIVASRNNNLNVVEYLLKIPDIQINYNNGDALMGAINNGNFEMVKYLIENGANIDIKDFLFSAVLSYLGNSEKNIQIIKYLLEKKINVNPSVLFLANGNKKVIELIKDFI